MALIRILPLLLLGLLTACLRPTLPDLSGLPDQPADFPPPGMAAVMAEQDPVLPIASDRSWLHIRVGRAGRLARLGHNHILSTRAVRGWVAKDDQRIWAAAYIPVETLEVDRPELRAAAGEGFESEPSAADREGTRANLLGPAVLDAERHPFLLAELDGTLDAPTVRFTVVGRTFTVPVAMSIESTDGGLVAQGRFTLDHANLGLEPYSALGGALRVAETLELSFHIEAR